MRQLGRGGEGPCEMLAANLAEEAKAKDAEGSTAVTGDDTRQRSTISTACVGGAAFQRPRR